MIRLHISTFFFVNFQAVFSNSIGVEQSGQRIKNSICEELETPGAHKCRMKCQTTST